MENEFALEIPESQRDAFSRLLKLDDAARRSLQSALETVKPRASLLDLASELKPMLGPTLEESLDMLSMLSSLYVSMDRSGESEAGFATRVLQAARSAKLLELEPSDTDWAHLSGFLTTLLSQHDTLGVTAKAHGLVYENEHVFCDARIISDIRPVFKPSLRGGPAAALVLHTLRLTYHLGERPGTREFYLSIDEAQLRQLKDLIERAEQKEKALQEFARKGGVNVLST